MQRLEKQENVKRLQTLCEHNQSINTVFYVCAHRGDIRQKQKQPTNQSTNQPTNQPKSIILTYPQDYVQSI